jgi:tetratricopeptide (TPR) repeat protein
VHAFETKPLSGIGPDTFQFYWAQHAPTTEPARNGHSLYLQTLAETGVVGLALIAGFFLVLLGTGVRRTLDARVRTRVRTTLAAATAALLAFCVAAGYDWLWQLPAVPLVALLLGAAILASRKPASRASRESRLDRRRATALRGLAAIAAICAIIAIAIPYGATVAIRSSQADVGAGRLSAALGAAATAQRLEPYAATPRLQRALILERAGELREAQAAIAQATAREPTSSGIWLARARIDAESGRESAAAADYRRAHALNPKSATTELGR